MSTITLPEIPEGLDLEDYVAAFLQCGGYYTEKSLIESGESQVLELDILAWKPSDCPPQHDLFEVKGGNWGFPDLFKVYGWQTYLRPRGVKAAYFIAPKGKRTQRNLEYTRDKCADIGITLVTHEDISDLGGRLKELGLTPDTTNSLDHAMWRFSFWLERQMQKVVTNFRNTQKNIQGPQEIYGYQELIRNGLLQARDVRERLASLYQAHFDHQFLAKSVAAELDGHAWSAENPADGRHWKEAMQGSKHPIVQASMYYQHRARLDILKGAVEFALLEKHGALPPERIIRFLGLEMPAEFLPTNFHSAVADLQRIQGFEKTPVVWQSFLWKWGGFFLVDQEGDEKAALAQECGLTIEALEACLAIYETLFPISAGWFAQFQGTKILKLFPAPFMGIGANYRLQRIEAENFNAGFGQSRYLHLVTNLVKWNNSTVELLGFGVPKGKS